MLSLYVTVVLQVFTRWAAVLYLFQGDHLCEKPGNVRDFDGCQRNIREKIVSGKSGLKLFIVSFRFASILDFAEFVHFILVSDHALLHSSFHH